MSNERVLVIDDEPDIRELLSLTLKRMGIACDVAMNCQQGLDYIQKKDYFLVLTDMRLPDGDGFNIIRVIQKQKPALLVAVITAFGSIEEAVHALKAGAFDYISKPIDLSLLKALIHTTLHLQQQPEIEDESLIGKSSLIMALRQDVVKLARSQAPVFIYGESGVGKELVARLIHAHSPRRDKPFMAINCGAIPSELMESEFFGHKKGSFTGAIQDKEGLLTAAAGGTLLLDEIAELPLIMQVKLLRAIQEKAVKPIGALHENPVDVRILSASNKNLQEEIAAGRFRQELYYRINVIELTVPPLRDRKEDIGLLANHILQKLVTDHQYPPHTLSAEALKELQGYDFPGNVRELENILERAIALNNESMIKAADLQLPAHATTYAKPVGSGDLDKALEAHEKALILEALNQTKWNRTSAARRLGLTLRTLRYRLKKLGLE